MTHVSAILSDAWCIMQCIAQLKIASVDRNIKITVTSNLVSKNKSVAFLIELSLPSKAV